MFSQNLLAFKEFLLFLKQVNLFDNEINQTANLFAIELESELFIENCKAFIRIVFPLKLNALFSMTINDCDPLTHMHLHVYPSKIMPKTFNISMDWTTFFSYILLKGF